MIDYRNLNYLKEGNLKQQAAYQVLTNYQVLIKLQTFSPILVGTIPIHIDIDSSDLDIICEVTDPLLFTSTLKRAFGKEKGFQLTELSERQAYVASFFIHHFEIEIFGQNIPTHQQNAYRHMLIEDKLLTEKGEAFRQEIIRLKKQGYKTEPAFALLLGLQGDPYEALLTLETQ